MALSYFSAGVLIAVGLRSLIEQVTTYLAYWWKNPSTVDHVLGIVVGFGLITVGYRWAQARQEKAKRKKVSSEMTPTQAFWLGAGATIAGIWGALPYFAAIDLILKSDISDWEAVGVLAYYNLIFMSPLALLVLIRACAGKRADGVFDWVNRLFTVWGKAILIVTMIVLGLVMVADSVGWFIGHPLIPVD